VAITAAVGLEAQPAITPSSTTAIAAASLASGQQLPSPPTQDNGAPRVNVSRRHRRAAEKLFLAGVKAIENNVPGTAEKCFLQAHGIDPNNQRYPLSAEVARQYVVAQLVQRAEKEKLLGDKDASLVAIEEAMRLDPQNPLVTKYFDAPKTEASASPPALRALRDKAAPPIILAPQKGDHAFHLRADERSLILQVLNVYGVQATIDSSVISRRIHFDTDEVDFAEAANLIELATDTFLVPLDSFHVFVAADTKENRNKYERYTTETIYFPGLANTELADMGNIARNVFGAEHVAIDPGHGAITVRTPEPDSEVLNEVYAELLGGRSVLQLEVHLYEIDKTKATNVGMILPTSTTIFNVPSEVKSILSNNASLVNEILKSDPALAGNYEAILAALIASGALTGTVFNSPFAVFGGGLTEMGLDLSGVSVNMLLNSSDARSLDQLELRVLDQEDATIRSGERYPIMTSSFSSLGSGSSSSASTIPQIQYQDLGLTLKVRPRIELNNDVSLDLDLKVSSLAGASLNNIPILANRQYTGVVSVRLGDSALIVSDLSKQESLELTGVPGLDDIPGLSGATNRQDTKDIMELAIMITPHVIRQGHQETVGPMLLLPRP
jgi:hypothetical protein